MPLTNLKNSISKLGKESLFEILHLIGSNLKEIYDCKMVRVNLEDLYEGMLVCQYVTGQSRPEPITKFISPEASVISQAFLKNEIVLSWKLPEGFIKIQDPFEKLSGIKATAVFPITHQLKPIGTLSLDRGEEGEFLNEKQQKDISNFLSDISGVLDRAKRFHQKLSFSRHLDLARKKEAAWRMMRSAVQLIDKLTLASVWVPSSIQNPKPIIQEPNDRVEIFAAFSKNKEDALIYNNREQINIHKKNLINRIVVFDKSSGLKAKDRNQKAVYIEDIMSKSFSRKSVAQQIDLVSLYQVPKINIESGQIVCVINYYTNTKHQFTDFEKRLLENHASMVEKLILEENPEHIEIEVLGEIEELLSDTSDTLQPFLQNILAKTSELIGADSGTISILKIIDGRSWLVVENETGQLVGAKSRGWMKSKIPQLPVGGEEIPYANRSLNGYVAHTARPLMIANVENEKNGFYKSLSSQIKSELAVPIIHGNRVLGVINQDSFRKNFFTQEHQKILQIISSLISPKVYNLKQIEILKQEMGQLRQDIEYRDPKVSSYHFGNVIGKSQNINSLVYQIQTVVESICNRMLNWEKSQLQETVTGLPCLLIHGQTGSGKEFFFNNIYSHLNKNFQKNKGSTFKLPLKKTNIAAYSGELTYSELFGHKKGSFTGAGEDRKGYFEEANKGTIFLDEVGEMPLETQVKLLRVLESGEFMRVGEAKTRYTDVRIIAATNKNLETLVSKGKFRNDLFFRLKTVSIRIPTLKERIEDLSLLVERFSLEFTRSNDLIYKGFMPEAIKIMKKYNWPGNIRELKNFVEKILVIEKGERINKEMVEKELVQISPDLEPNPALPMLVNQTTDKAEIDLILRQLFLLKQDTEIIQKLLVTKSISKNDNTNLNMLDDYKSEDLHFRKKSMEITEDGHFLIRDDAIGDFTLPALEEEAIKRSLRYFNNNRRKTAKKLGMSERTLYRKIEEYNIEPKFKKTN